MRRLLVICGPALGHVARVSLVLEALVAHRKDVAITLAIPSKSDHIDTLRRPNVDLRVIAMDPTGERSSSVAFADGIDPLIRSVKPDLLLYDGNHLEWLVYVTPPECPVLRITNVFLTDHARNGTLQEALFERHGALWNHQRVRRGLKPVSGPGDIFSPDGILLADPDPVCELFSPLPSSLIPCGPLCLTSDEDLPDELATTDRLLICSVGSTGGDAARFETIKAIRANGDFAKTVYVGSEWQSAARTSAFDHSYPWLPLGKALSRAALCITHGGTGSTYAALAHGVPVLTSAFHENQALLETCLESLGVGSRLSTPEATDWQSLQTPDVAAYDHTGSPARHAEVIASWL